jgi:type II secretory ATPase GspE/PulE/Tfp pilus assembly ATPase PilB-like protein
MQCQLLDKLRRSMPKVDNAAEIMKLLALWTQDDAADVQVSRLLELARQRHVSHVYIDASPEGGRILLRVDGLVLPAFALSPCQFQALLCAMAAHAQMAVTEGNTQNAEGLIRGEPAQEGATFRVGLLRTFSGPQLTLRALPTQFHHSLAPRERWPEQASNAAELMKQYPCGLIVFCYRGRSTYFETMGEWLYGLANGGGRYVLVTDAPNTWPLHENVFQLRLEGSEESWERELRAATAQDFDVVAIAGRNDDDAIRRAVLTTFEDHFVLVNTSRASVLDTLMWMMSDLPIGADRVSQILVGLIGTYCARRICPRCARVQSPADLELPIPGWGATPLRDVLKTHGLGALPEGEWLWGEGCEECNRTGYVLPSRELLPLVEAIHIDWELANVCSSRPRRQELQAALAARGFRTYFEQAFDLAQSGRTTIQEAVRVGLARRANR